MKRVIDGKRYDTDTANCIGGYRFSYPSNFRFIEEHLYITKNGSYFIAGQGGPMTEYAQDTGNNSCCSGSKITPLTREEAFRFCQKHDLNETLEEHFNDTIVDA